jgi:hypothetical protein
MVHRQFNANNSPQGNSPQLKNKSIHRRASSSQANLRKTFKGGQFTANNSPQEAKRQKKSNISQSSPQGAYNGNLLYGELSKNSLQTIHCKQFTAINSPHKGKNTKVEQFTV